MARWPAWSSLLVVVVVALAGQAGTAATAWAIHGARGEVLRGGVADALWMEALGYGAAGLIAAVFAIASRHREWHLLSLAGVAVALVGLGTRHAALALEVADGLSPAIAIVATVLAVVGTLCIAGLAAVRAVEEQPRLGTEFAVCAAVLVALAPLAAVNSVLLPTLRAEVTAPGPRP